MSCIFLTTMIIYIYIYIYIYVYMYKAFWNQKNKCCTHLSKMKKNICFASFLHWKSKILTSRVNVCIYAYIVNLKLYTVIFPSIVITRDQIANIRWIMGKAREFQKNIYFCFIDYAKAFDCGSKQPVYNSSRDGQFFYQTTLPASWEICMQLKK